MLLLASSEMCAGDVERTGDAKVEKVPQFSPSPVIRLAEISRLLFLNQRHSSLNNLLWSSAENASLATHLTEATNFQCSQYR